MHILELGLSFDFHHYTLDNEINPFLTHIDIPVDHINPNFTAELQPLCLQLERQRPLVN
jgi:hypothetical protein